MAKYLETCPFISTKALKCVIAQEKIYHWASRRELVGLHAWPGSGVAAWLGDCVHHHHHGISFSGLGYICWDLGNWGVRVYSLSPGFWQSFVTIGVHKDHLPALARFCKKQLTSFFVRLLFFVKCNHYH